LTELSWRWIMFINVPIALASAVYALRLISEVDRGERRGGFDLSGALTATLGLSLLVLGIVRTDQTGWSSVPTLAIIAAGILLLGTFVAIEGRVAHSPLMPLRIWSSPTLRAANVVVLMLGGASFSMWFFLSLYLQEVRGDSPIATGLAFLPMTLCIVVGSTVASRLVHRIGARPLLAAGMLSLTAGLVLYTQLSTGGSYWIGMFGPSLLTAVGIGLSFTPAAISGVAGVASDEAGLASGLVNTSRMFGGALGLAVLATLATSRTTAERHLGVSTHLALTDGFHFAFLIAAAMALTGALVAFALPRTEHELAHVRERRTAAVEA